MKKILILSMSFVCLTFFSKDVSASLLLEPYYGFNMAGKAKEKDTGKELDFSGSSLGGRLGYQNIGFMIGLDFRRSSYAAQRTRSDFNTTTYAAFIGLNLPILVRVWGELVFQGSGEWDFKDYSKKAEIDSTSGYRLGVGFTALPLISINFELDKPSFKYKDPGDQADFTSYLVSISIPFNL